MLGSFEGAIEDFLLGSSAGDAVVGLAARASGTLGDALPAGRAIEVEVGGVVRAGSDALDRGTCYCELASSASRAGAGGGTSAAITEGVAEIALVGGGGVVLGRAGGTARETGGSAGGTPGGAGGARAGSRDLVVATGTRGGADGGGGVGEVAGGAEGAVRSGAP